MAEKALEVFTARINDTASNLDGLAEVRSQLDSAASSFVQTINHYINDQDRKLAAEIAAGLPADKLEERRTKVELANQIMETCNTIRVTTFKAQALRQPELMDKVPPLFETIEATRAKLQSITLEEVNLKQLATVAQTAASYKAGTEKIVKNFADSLTIGTARNGSGTELDTLIQGIVDRSIERTRTYAQTSADGLSQASRLVIGGLIAMAVIGLVVALLIIRGVNKALTVMAESLTQGSLQVAAASGQVSSASQALAEGASEQAASLEEISSSIEELSSMTKRNAENAQAGKNLRQPSPQRRRSRCRRDGAHAGRHERNPAIVQRHFQDHQDDRRNCLPDEHPRAERRRRGRPRG